MNSQKKSNYLKGGWLLLIKVVATILIVFLIEQILHLFIKNDELGQALKPFHNNYFSFSGYYLTSPGLSSEFSHAPSATFRFAVFTLFGYLIFAVLSIIISFLFKKENIRKKINAGLFYAFLICAFLLAFMFPGRKSILKENEISITSYHYWFIPSTEYVPFSAIKNVNYQYVPDYDGYNKTYLYYIVITLQTIDGREITLGELEAEDKKGTLTHKPETILSPELKAMAERVVGLVNKKITTKN